MSAVIGHEAIVRELQSLAASEDPPHALLFAGAEGSGRSLLALEYARLLNCEAAPPSPAVPCGVCRPCRLIAEGAHPDVIHLGPGDTLCRPQPGESSHEKHPDSRDIRICQVRGLIDLVARFPFEARTRMVLIEPADRLGREAAHTILKTLEEPPGHTVFCLVTAAPEVIIETVRSRCRRVDVRLVPPAETASGLVARGVDPAIAARAAAECRGLPGRAIAFAADPALMGDRDRLRARCSQVAASRVPARLAHAGELAEAWRRDRSVVLRALDAWEAFWEERLRAAAGECGASSAAGPVVALRAVSQARADLQAQVQARPALELMILTFPPVTLEPDPEEELSRYA
ncbi:MAG: hypothetical protein KJ053_07110 [Dehalococcoidia bacterium]|nr:hypothetical protein [Dehalococcoidia bacterium]